MILDVITVAVLGVLIVLLVRAAYALGRNPQQQISEHERFAMSRFALLWPQVGAGEQTGL